MSEMARQHVCEQEGAVKQMEREREEDRRAIRALHGAIVMLLKECDGDVTGVYSSPATRRMQAVIKACAQAIQRATQAPA